MSISVNEKDYKEPLTSEKIESLGFLRVGGLYQSKKKGFFTMVISIVRQTYLTWPNGKRPEEVTLYVVQHLVLDDEDIWTWRCHPSQLTSWENCYDKLG